MILPKELRPLPRQRKKNGGGGVKKSCVWVYSNNSYSDPQNYIIYITISDS